MSLIPESEVLRYSRPPSATTVSSVAKFQEDIREALGSEYETFLQGSYKNDTSVRDINDVDIVAIKKTTVSSVFSSERIDRTVTWNDLFGDVARKIHASPKFAGKTSYGDKCVIVKADWKADVVPAVRISSAETDPIAIYSFKQRQERQNFPRIHYRNGVTKNQETNSAFKPIVRMLKRWAANHWPNGGIAPSYYLECLVSNVPKERFSGNLADAFFSVALYIEENIKPTMPVVVWSVARDKDILVPDEWNNTQYSQFHAQLSASTFPLASALLATSEADARRNWRRAFNE